MNRAFSRLLHRDFFAALAFAFVGMQHPAFCARAEQRRAAWKEVKQMETPSLQSFLAVFPNGKYAEAARFALALHKRIAAIRSGKEKSALVIPFAQLGARWEGWKQRRPEKSAVGVYRNQSTIGVFPVLGCMTLSMDWSSLPITPTGDGSILALKTYGLKFAYINNIVFQSGSGKDDIIYFGVIYGLGLVHLQGAGKVILPEGKEITLN